MGLDMYVYRTKQTIPDTNFVTPKDCEYEGDYDYNRYEEFKEHCLVWYWRKHPNLHGWFRQLWRSKGGGKENPEWYEFNGDNLKLTLEDIQNLRKAVLDKKLPHTEGFFFGVSNQDDDEDTLRFCKRAESVLADGWNIYYTSSW